MRIYFAGSIRGGRDEADVYPRIIDHLKNYGTILTEHVGDKRLTSAGETRLTDRQIHDRDSEWVYSADTLVAEVTQPSLGVGYELGKAVDTGKRIACLYRKAPDKKLSAMIAGSPGVTYIEYQNASDAILGLDNFFMKDGKVSNITENVKGHFGEAIKSEESVRKHLKPLVRRFKDLNERELREIIDVRGMETADQVVTFLDYDKVFRCGCGVPTRPYFDIECEQRMVMDPIRLRSVDEDDPLERIEPWDPEVGPGLLKAEESGVRVSEEYLNMRLLRYLETQLGWTGPGISGAADKWMRKFETVQTTLPHKHVSYLS